MKLQKRNIETERLVLHPYSIRYHSALFHLIHKNKPRLTHSFPNLLAATETAAECRDYVQQKIFDWNNNKAFGFQLFYKENHKLIGHFNIKDINWRKRECELAYFIDEEYNSRGLITEAIMRMLKTCFSELHLKHVFARIVTTNTASQKVVEKAGLKYEGTFYKDYITYDKKVVDTYRYGISSEDFLRLTE